MTRITSSDQVLLLLREQLRRLDGGRTGRAGRTAARGSATPPALQRARTLAALDGLADEEKRRTVVRALLSEELGDGLANDPSMQAVFDDVFRIIGSTDEGRDLLDRALRQLREEG
jgi:hypothetical protein